MQVLTKSTFACTKGSAPIVELIQSSDSSDENVGHPIDVYSLGVIAIELATGARPNPTKFDRSSVEAAVEDALARIRHEDQRNLARSCVRWDPRSRISKRVTN